MFNLIFTSFNFLDLSISSFLTSLTNLGNLGFILLQIIYIVIKYKDAFLAVIKCRELQRHEQSLVAENSMEKVKWLENKLDGNNQEITILFIIVIVIPLLALSSFF